MLGIFFAPLDLLSSIFHHALCTEKLTCINRFPSLLPKWVQPSRRFGGRTRGRLGYLFPRLLPSKTALTGCIPLQLPSLHSFLSPILVSTFSPPLLSVDPEYMTIPCDFLYPAYIVHPILYSLQIVPSHTKIKN